MLPHIVGSDPGAPATERPVVLPPVPAGDTHGRCPALPQIGCCLEKVVLAETQGLKDFGSDFRAFGRKGDFRADIGGVNTRHNRFCEMFRHQ